MPSDVVQLSKRINSVVHHTVLGIELIQSPRRQTLDIRYKTIYEIRHQYNINSDVTVSFS